MSEQAAKFVDQLRGEEYVGAFRKVRDRLAEVKLDRTRVKPIVKITGEFWAQTTEGDGNFNMFPFLEREDAQVVVEPVGTWIMYMIHQAKQMNLDRKGVTEDEAMPSAWRVDKRVAADLAARKKNAKLTLAESVFKREWNRLREALNDIPHGLTDQYELQRLGHPMYNSRAGGGEGHLEVAKNIYYTNKDLCHMVLSLKPFGCMPSTQSDGVQSAVINQYKDMIYLPIETSGEGEINAHSRVQMALGEARVKAKTEMDRVLEETGLSLDEVREYAAEHPELESAMYHVPHTKGVIGAGANFVKHVADAHGRRRHGRGAARAEPRREPLMGSPTDHELLYVGLDVGSTTVKAVVVDPVTDEILWKRLPAPRDQAAGEVPRVPDPDRDRLPACRRTASASSSPAPAAAASPPGSARSSCRRSTPSRWRWRSCTPRPARSSSSAARTPRSSSSRRPGDRQEEEDPVDERQVRRRHRRRHRQDQRQAAHPRRRALQHGLLGHQAPPGGRQVRRVRRDRHQRPAEAGVPPDELMASLFEAIIGRTCRC